MDGWKGGEDMSGTGTQLYRIGNFHAYRLHNRRHRLVPRQRKEIKLAQSRYSNLGLISILSPPYGWIYLWP